MVTLWRDSTGFWPSALLSLLDSIRRSTTLVFCGKCLLCDYCSYLYTFFVITFFPPHIFGMLILLLLNISFQRCHCTKSPSLAPEHGFGQFVLNMIGLWVFPSPSRANPMKRMDLYLYSFWTTLKTQTVSCLSLHIMKSIFQEKSDQVSKTEMRGEKKKSERCLAAWWLFFSFSERLLSLHSWIREAELMPAKINCAEIITLEGLNKLLQTRSVWTQPQECHGWQQSAGGDVVPLKTQSSIFTNCNAPLNTGNSLKLEFVSFPYKS